MSEIFLIVGLGNPGARYDNTRHNIGFMAVDRLAKRHGLTLAKVEHKAHTASGTIAGRKVMLAKPMTFMNLSGESVAPLARFYKIPPENIIVLHDDLDIAFGTLRIRKTGSSGGQNGLKSIIERLGTQDIPRIRIGIGRPPGRMDPADYVLHGFSSNERSEVPLLIGDAADAVERLLADGLVAAQQQWHSR